MVSLTFNKGVALMCSVLLTFGLSVDALDCYKCKTSDPNNACLTNPGAGGITTCVGGVSHCIVRLTYNTINNNMSEFERDCEVRVPVIGDKTECKTSGSTRECQVVCGSDKCNDVLKDQVESCVTTNCKSSATALLATPLLLISAAVMKALF